MNSENPVFRIASVVLASVMLIFAVMKAQGCQSTGELEPQPAAVEPAPENAGKTGAAAPAEPSPEEKTPELEPAVEAEVDAGKAPEFFPATKSGGFIPELKVQETPQQANPRQAPE